MRTVQDYFNYITGIIDKCEIVVNRSALHRGGGKLLSNIMAPIRQKRQPGVLDGLLFQDGALLNFKEYVKIAEGDYELIEYSYHYQRPDGYFFRYDKVRQVRAAECNEPVCHLHTNMEDIRFPTHSTNLEEILEMIQRNFYR